VTVALALRLPRLQTALAVYSGEVAEGGGHAGALSDQNSGSFFDHPMIAENCQIFGHFMGTRESQLQPNWRFF
jgi:hypothetical protein